MAWCRFAKVIAFSLMLTTMASVPLTGLGQSAPINPAAEAKREYTSVLAHADHPCDANTATAPYLRCMNGELAFVGQHLDAFVADLRGMAANSPGQLAALNKIDSEWRAYRKDICAFPFERSKGGTLSGPQAADCLLQVDRAYVKQLSDFYIWSQW